jgi:hypothetical protein
MLDRFGWWWWDFPDAWAAIPDGASGREAPGSPEREPAEDAGPAPGTDAGDDTRPGDAGWAGEEPEELGW